MMRPKPGMPTARRSRSSMRVISGPARPGSAGESPASVTSSTETAVAMGREMPMNPAHVNWLGALVAALSAFLVGGVWYSPLLFARPWLAATKVAEAELGRGHVRVFGGAFVLALVSAVNLAFF